MHIKAIRSTITLHINIHLQRAYNTCNYNTEIKVKKPGKVNRVELVFKTRQRTKIYYILL